MNELLKVVDWKAVLSYRVERQLTMHPSKCWVVRVLTFRQPRKVTTLFGPFRGNLGEQSATLIVNALNQQCREMDSEVEAGLTAEEHAYLSAGLKLPHRPAIDDDEIPF